VVQPTAAGAGAAGAAAGAVAAGSEVAGAEAAATAGAGAAAAAGAGAGAGAAASEVSVAAEEAAEEEALYRFKHVSVGGRGLHSFTLELNLSTFGTHSWVKLGYVGHKDSSS